MGGLFACVGSYHKFLFQQGITLCLSGYQVSGIKPLVVIVLSEMNFILVSHSLGNK
jgi:hypothetical protein